jgi:PAS domain S-box-containing protein
MIEPNRDPAHLVDGKYGIADLVDLAQLRTLFERFTEATGFTIGFLDHPGLNILIATGWRDICTKFHRSCPLSAANCLKSNRHLLNHLDEAGKVVIEPCENGLVDCATPIIVRGKHIASLATGQLLLEKPDLDRFRRQARLFGFDEREYLNALAEIPVVKEDKLKAVTTFLGEMALVISQIGYTRLVSREEEERFRGFFNTITEYGYMVSPDARVLDANRAALDALGYEQNELLGKPLASIYAPESHEAMKSALAAWKRTGKIHDMEMVIQTKDGRHRTVILNATAVHNADGSLQHSVSVQHDITERKRAEERIRFQAQLLDSVRESVVATDLEGRILYWGRGAEQLYGYKAEETMGKPYRQFAGSIEEVEDETLKRHLVAHGSWRGENLQRRKDGTTFWSSALVSLVTDDRGRPCGFIGIDHDITDRKQAEEALRCETERRQREAAVAAAVAASARLAEGEVRELAAELTEAAAGALEVERVGVWLFQEGGVRLVNVDNYAASTGKHSSGAVLLEHEYRNEFAALASSQYVDAHDPLTDPRTAGYVEGYLKPQRITSMLDAVIRLGGSNMGVLCFEHVDRPHHWENDEITFACQLANQVALAVSNHERRQADKALRESEERFRQLAENAQEWIWEVDANGLYTYASSVVETVLGYRPEEIVGRKYFYDLFHPEDREILKKGALEIMALKQSFQAFINRNVHKDGRIVWLSTSGVPVLDAEKNLLGYRGADTDITERKRMEQEHLRAQKLESLGLLAGGIAHDFNNILTAILGHAELALEESAPLSPARDSISQIKTASLRAAELCGQLLAYSGKGRFEKRDIALGDLIGEMLHMLKTCISKKCILNLNLEKELPLVHGDPSQIRQILMNLVLNASEAIGDGSGVISISTGAMECSEEYLAENYISEARSPGLYVSLEVSDTGCGMDRTTLQCIFEPFYSTKFTGRGLGLSAVLGIVRSHGGGLRVYSELNKGSTFKVLFPAVTTSGSEDTARDSGPASGWRGKGTVLLVDDEEAVRAISRRLLQRLGLGVILAEDGQRAVELYRERQADIDLVLLDLTMPRMDGEQTFRGLRQINPDVRVVLASGYGENDVASRFAGKSLTGCLQKPYTLVRLRELLSGLLPAANAADPNGN